MQKYFVLLLFLFLNFQCTTRDSNKNNFEDWLPKKETEAIIYGEVKYDDPRLIELQNKFVKATQENAQWMSEYIKKYDGPLPYHKNLGLTEDEYNELLEMYETADLQLVETGRENISVEYHDKIIQFSGTGILEFIKNISIDLESNTVRWLDKKLDLDRIDTVKTEDNIYHSEWIGYTWKYTSNKDLYDMTLEEMQVENIEIYKFTLGRLNTSKQTFIKLHVLEVLNWEKQVSFEVPIILKN